MSDERRALMVATLNRALATLTDLYAQAKYAHWNVRGTANFYALHLLFDQVATAVLPLIDLVAERIVQLGGTAHGRLTDARRSSILTEAASGSRAANDLVLDLARKSASAYAFCTDASRGAAEIGDEATNTLMADAAKALDKQRWMLEASIVV